MTEPEVQKFLSGLDCLLLNLRDGKCPDKQELAEIESDARRCGESLLRSIRSERNKFWESEQ